MRGERSHHCAIPATQFCLPWLFPLVYGLVCHDGKQSLSRHVTEIRMKLTEEAKGSVTKTKICLHKSMAHQADAHLWFLKYDTTKNISTLDGMLVHRRVTLSIRFAGTHLYSRVERGTVRVKCLAQQHNTMSPARARTRTV